MGGKLSRISRPVPRRPTAAEILALAGTVKTCPTVDDIVSLAGGTALGLSVSGGSVSVSDTNANTEILSVTIPAGTIEENGSLSINLGGTWGSEGGASLIIRVYVNGFPYNVQWAPAGSLDYSMTVNVGFFIDGVDTATLNYSVLTSGQGKPNSGNEIIDFADPLTVSVSVQWSAASAGNFFDMVGFTAKYSPPGTAF